MSPGTPHYQTATTPPPPPAQGRDCLDHHGVPVILVSGIRKLPPPHMSLDTQETEKETLEPCCIISLFSMIFLVGSGEREGEGGKHRKEPSKS